MLIYNDTKTTSHIMILADPQASKPTQLVDFQFEAALPQIPYHHVTFYIPQFHSLRVILSYCARLNKISYLLNKKMFRN